MSIPIRPEQGAPAGLAATPGSGAIVTAQSSPQPSSARLAKHESTQIICDDRPGWAGERLADVGTIPMVLTAAEFGAYIAAESEKWAKVVKLVAQ